MGEGITGATISGGGQRGAPNQITKNYGTVGGGEGNVAGEGSTVAGGSANTAINFHSTVGGGSNNEATAQEATVAGGLKDVASGRFAAVGGGAANVASGINSAVAGGSGNVADFTYSTVGGGVQNSASSTAAVVAGGDHNLAQGAYSAALGGLNNDAEGYLATIAGGAGNVAAGSYSAIPGGFANSAAGDYSFAVGRKAAVQADHPGTFLFADSSTFPFPSLAPNEFAVRATGGVRLVTAIDGSGTPLAGVRLSAGSGAWEILSDAGSKSGFAAVDDNLILERLMTVPVTSWHYRGQDASILHLGPTAQDFRAAFRLGDDSHYVSTVDADGVALAAIQGLYRIVKDQRPASQPTVPSLEARLAFSNVLATASLFLAGFALWGRGTKLQAARRRPKVRLHRRLRNI